MTSEPQLLPAAAPKDSPPFGWEWFRWSFQSFANSLASRLGGPVYLVGSALHRHRPADYDVRVVLEEHDLVRLFGLADDKKRPDGQLWNTRQWAMGREQLKQSRRLSRAMRVNVDFQIQTVHEAEQRATRPRLRLDTASDGFFDAGLGDP